MFHAIATLGGYVLTTQKQQEATAALKEHGSQRAAAKALGIAQSTLNAHLKAARAWDNADPSIQQVAAEFGIEDMSIVRGGWLKNKSASLRIDIAKEQERSLAEAMAKAFENVPPYERPKARPVLTNDLMTVYPLYDAHIGMMAWGKETRGPNYDLKLAAKDIRQSFSDISVITPDSKDALLILGGDTVHIDDSTNATPANGHGLSVDGRYEKVIDSTIEMLSHTVEFLSQKHKTVRVVVLRGNHDEHSHIPIRIGLKERYRHTEGIEFPVLEGMDKSEIYWHQHGQSTIAAQHGDKSPPQRLCMIIADQCPFWSSTRDRHVYTGHKHSLQVQQFPGVTHHQMQAFCPPDDYGAMFGGRRALQSHTFDKSRGLINTALDPIWRL